jgi:hypothetical protein
MVEEEDVSDDDDDWGFTLSTGNQARTLVNVEGQAVKSGKMDGSCTDLFGRSISDKVGRLLSPAENVEMFKPLASVKSVLSYGGSGTKFRIIHLGALMRKQNGDACCRLIGNGSSFCIWKECTTTHLGDKLPINSNWRCVVQVLDMSLFCEPVVQRSQVTDLLFACWMIDKTSLKEWTQPFAIASSLDEVINEELLSATKTFKSQAWVFRTPNKSSQKTVDEELNEMLTLMETQNLYKRKVTSSEEMNKIKSNDNVFLAEVTNAM